jgi:hypothetical protein
VRLITSLLVVPKYFGCVVCRFHIAAGAELRPDRHHKQIVWSVAKSASINLRKWFLSPTSSIKPWFHTEENLPLCSSYLPLGVPNWVASTANQRAAMQEEFEALQRNQTWKLVPCPPRANVITDKWVFKHRLPSDGTLERYKERSVV